MYFCCAENFTRRAESWKVYSWCTKQGTKLEAHTNHTAGASLRWLPSTMLRLCLWSWPRLCSRPTFHSNWIFGRRSCRKASPVLEFILTMCEESLFFCDYCTKVDIKFKSHSASSKQTTSITYSCTFRGECCVCCVVRMIYIIVNKELYWKCV